jgi:hypothetical protein
MKRIKNVTKVSAFSASAVNFTQGIKLLAVPNPRQIEN